MEGDKEGKIRKNICNILNNKEKERKRERMKILATEGKKIFSTYTSDKRFDLGIYRDYLELNIGKK